MKTFGENLAALMKAKRLSARELARVLKISSKTVDEWIGSKGRMPRNPDHVRKLAEFFSVSTHFLLFNEEDPRSLLGEILESTVVHSGLYQLTLKKVQKRPSTGKDETD